MVEIEQDWFRVFARRALASDETGKKDSKLCFLLTFLLYMGCDPPRSSLNIISVSSKLAPHQLFFAAFVS